MAKGDKTELFMKFTKEGGSQVAAEGQVDLDLSGSSSNPLLKDFRAGYIFEIDRFSFRAGTVDEDGKVGADSEDDEDDEKKKKKKKKGAKAIGKRGPYQSWRRGERTRFPIDIQPISITRDIDAASASLMKACIEGKVFDGATLIKRKPAGGPGGGEVFLRLDFVDVLVIEVEWEEEEEVKEDIKFICRAVTMTYRPQLPDGSLGPTVTGFWSMVPGDRAVTLR